MFSKTPSSHNDQTYEDQLSMMKNLKYLIIASFIFLSCEKQTEYEGPVVLTGDVVQITPLGAELHGRVTHQSDEPGVKYGFIISKKPSPEPGQGEIIGCDVDQNGYFSFYMGSGHRNDAKYYVRACAWTAGGLVYGNRLLFESQGSNPPEIDSFNPHSGPIGTQVAIKGKNFGYMKDEMNVFFGDVKVMVDSLSDQQIKVTIPKISLGSDVIISVEAAGKKAVSAEKFSMWFPWKKIQDINNLWIGAYFQIGQLGYMLNKGSLSILDLQTMQWNEPRNYPFNETIALFAGVIDQTAYILFPDGFRSYDPMENQWKDLAFPPVPSIREIHLWSQYGVRYNYFFTVLNNKIILGTLKDNMVMYEYAPETNSWSVLSDTNPGILLAPAGSFALSLNGSLYLGINKDPVSQFWKFDSGNNDWSLIGEVPINSRNVWGLAIANDKFYISFGRNNEWPSESTGEIWEFDPIRNNWLNYHSCSEQARATASFSYNGKLYFITSWTMWEFDPSKN